MNWKVMVRVHGSGGTGVRIPRTGEKASGVATKRLVTVGKT
jgi:hypothetical protein